METIIQALVTLSVALIGLSWYTQEKTRRKIERYESLIEYLDSFYAYDRGETSKDDPKIQVHRFITQYRVSFMYFPDNVVKKIGILFDMLELNRAIPASIDEKKEAISNLMIEIREDVLDPWICKLSLNFNFLKKTKLSSEDFKHVGIDLR